ncbi:hypothetical protein J7F03_36055 [Streptomyces sp. ISL-43]|uniref:hypothetical protein n=1 Tax=Streptomyces sp. ISL-43 TaxID=2819183 RepID=UPI001BECDBA0|nr:hypothetical protein [Streptomyces sp. ISL-43]MBT2452376.1 hypothetical protein [Streptomyces sp. ISL-43]
MATLVHGVAVACRPRPARPRGLPEQASSALLVRTLGIRDAAIGALMATASGGTPQRTAVVCRTAAGLWDALLFGGLVPGRAQRAKAASAALAWAALCGWTLTGEDRPAAPLAEDATMAALRVVQSTTRART